jgi:ABC-type nitrate/sulfonate/bicarbonate transport system substrate-binding protein
MHEYGTRHWRNRWMGLAAGLLLVMACAAPAAQPSGAPASQPAPAAPAKPAASAPSAPSAPLPPGAVVPPKPGQQHTFQLGVVALVSYMYPMWVALEKGFWAEQGLNVEITTCQTNEAVAALVSGSLDVLMCPTDSCTTALSKGAQIRMVNDFLVEAPYDLIAKRDVATVADLRGKKVGVSSLNAGSGTLVKIMLRGRGLGPDDYELVQAGGNPQRYAALQSGGVDASILSDPLNFAALLEGYHALLNFTEIVPRYSFSSDWVLNSWLDTAANRDYLVGFQAAQIKGKRWAHDPANKAAIIEMIVTRTSTTPTVAERVYDFYVAKNPHLVGVEDLQVEPVQTVAQILREWENLPDLPPDNVWRDGSYIQRARQLAGQ